MVGCFEDDNDTKKKPPVVANKATTGKPTTTSGSGTVRLGRQSPRNGNGAKPTNTRAPNAARSAVAAPASRS